MKKILFLLMLLTFGISSVNAECSNDEINRLKELSKNIKVEYDYAPDAFFEEDGITVELDGVFETKITGLIEDIFIYDEEYDMEYSYENSDNGVLTLGYLYGGNYSYEIYSESCGIIEKLEFNIPKYNFYSEDPLCEGIDENKLAICGKWYDTDVDYDTFKKMIQNYKNNKTEQTLDNDTGIIDTIVNFYDMYIKDYVIYIVASILIIIVIIISIMFYKKRRVLE